MVRCAQGWNVPERDVRDRCVRGWNVSELDVSDWDALGRIEVPFDVSYAVVTKTISSGLVDKISTTNTIDILWIEDVPKSVDYFFKFLVHNSSWSGNQP